MPSAACIIVYVTENGFSFLNEPFVIVSKKHVSKRNESDLLSAFEGLGKRQHINELEVCSHRYPCGQS